MARPRKGKELRQNITLRLEPSEKELLEKHFGGVQVALDSVLESIYKSKTKRKAGIMKKINGDEYFGALDYLAVSNPNAMEYQYLRTVNVLNNFDKYIGEFYRDENSLYAKAQDNGEFLHIADIDWEKLEEKI